MGRPIVTLPSAVTRLTDDQIVVSVGPYRFHTSPASGTSSLARSRGSASPPQRILRFVSPVHPAVLNIFHVAGVACITVGRLSSMHLRSSKPSLAARVVASSPTPPLMSGR